MSIDPEMQRWAQDELKETTESIKTRTKERDDAIKQKEDLCLHADKQKLGSNELFLDLEKVRALDDKIADLSFELGRKAAVTPGCYGVGTGKERLPQQ